MDLESRLARLERRNRWLTGSVITLGLALLVSLSVLQVPNAEAEEPVIHLDLPDEPSLLGPPAKEVPEVGCAHTVPLVIYAPWSVLIEGRETDRQETGVLIKACDATPWQTI